MRIIHTADWHLGQHFMGKSREPEHQAFLDWLLCVIKERDIDALIVAGDIFDTGTPPSYARLMYNWFVAETLKANCQLLVLGGNHDSVSMLEESSELLRYLNVHLIAKPTDNPADQVVQLRSRNAEGAPGALVCAVPFLRPRYVVTSIAGQDGTDKNEQLQSAIAAHYQSVYEAAVKLREDNQWDCPIITTGHLTAVGVTRSDSVREIYIGTLEAFPASAFPPADYIALGHIHGPQKVAGNDKIRYSGSPIPLSFDETGRGLKKSIVQISTGTGSNLEVELIDVPEFRTLRTIRGDLKEIEQQLKDIPTDAGNDDKTTWLEVIVSTQDYLSDLQQRIDVLAADRNVDVLLVRREREHKNASLTTAQKQTLDELSVEEVFAYRLKEAFAEVSSAESDHSVGVKPEGVKQEEVVDRLKAMYREVVGEVRGGDSS